MGILIIFVIILIAGIIGIKLFYDSNFEIRCLMGIIATTLSSIALFIMCVLLILKPIEVQHNIIYYENVKQQVEQSFGEVENAGLVKEVIEVNTFIDREKYMSQNFMINIFYSKKIGNLEKISIR